MAEEITLRELQSRVDFLIGYISMQPKWQDRTLEECRQFFAEAFAELKEQSDG